MRHLGSAVGIALGALALIAALAPAPPAPDDAGELKSLAEARADMARKIADYFADPRLAALESRGEARGIPGADQVEVWTRRVVDARLDAAPGRDDRIAILTEDLERTRAIEIRIKAVAENTPGLSKVETFKVEFYRLDAQYRLAKEKAGR